MANFGSGVTPGTGATIDRAHNASGAISHGDVVVKISGQWQVAQADATSTLGVAGVRKNDVGVAVSAGVANAPVAVVTHGLVENATGILAGEVYCVSATTAGDFETHSTITEDTDYVAVVGVGVSTTSLYVSAISANVVKNLI